MQPSFCAGFSRSDVDGSSITHELPRMASPYSQVQFALYSVHIGPKLLRQSQLHFGVLSAGQVILQVSLSPRPQDTISQELEPSATTSGGCLH